MNEPIAMKGGGYYSLATLGAKHVIDGAAPMVLGAIARMPDGAGPFVFSDMGTADGGTSIDLVTAVIAAVRARWPGRDIAVIHTDQPRNDFNALIANVYGRPAETGVHWLQSATSFYNQILPSGMLDFGFSATAMHWLSAKPCDILDHVQAVGARGAELEAFQRRGYADWRQILLHRASELKAGGRLVLVNFCRDDEGRYLGHTGGVNMFDTFNRIWRAFLADARIGEAEYRAMTLPQYYKSLAEFTEPLSDPEDPVFRAGLRLETAETRIVPCPFAAEFRRNRDAAGFAKAYIPTMQSWTESTFFAALDSRRPLAERQALIDCFYAAYAALVAADPDDHGMGYVHAYLTIARV